MPAWRRAANRVRSLIRALPIRVRRAEFRQSGPAVAADEPRMRDGAGCVSCVGQGAIHVTVGDAGRAKNKQALPLPV